MALFVNDASLQLPRLRTRTPFAEVFYRNNRGLARIRVTRMG
jgi:hypothetical protein